jgi:hypothetical protein
VARDAAGALDQEKSSSLVKILQGMNGASPLAKNWLRGAFEAVAARSLKSESDFPTQNLIAYFEDKSNDPQSRRVAFEWIVKAEPGYADKVIPSALDDASSEMRRDAVTFHTSAAKSFLDAGKKDEARAEYLKSLSGAGDEDQVKELQAALKDLGYDVDLVQHAGFLMNWHLIGPFDNKAGKGFAVAYPPESEIDLGKSYDSGYTDKDDKPVGLVSWKPFSSKMTEGDFDIAKLTAPYKGAVMYAETEYESDKAQPVEFRLSTPNAWKLWLNGEPLFAREEYHRGRFFDQYQVRGELKPGKNTLLLKVCQNEQKDDWAQDWVFQFRVCDLTGRALRSEAGDQAATKPASKDVSAAR